MKKVFALLAVFGLVLVGCSSSSTSDTNPCGDYPAEIGMVTDTGGINDQSFNQGTWEGIEQYCSENQVGATYIESSDETDYIPNLEQLASEYGIVIASGFYFAEPMYVVAQEYPDTSFVLIDGQPTNPDTGEVEDLPNVTSYLYAEEQPGYEVGYIAGSMTQTNTVGFIGGMPVPAVEKYGYGFVAGVHDANPDATVLFQYANTFTDTSIGEQMAATMYSEGADIIFAAAGGTGAGVINEAKTLTQQGTPVWVIGVDRNQFDDGIYDDAGDSVVLTSALKDTGTAAYNALVSYFAGTLTGGTVTITLNDADGIPADNPNVPTDVYDATEAQADLIKSGEIVVPTTQEETQAYIGDMDVQGW